MRPTRDYQTLWTEGYRSASFQAGCEPQSEQINLALSERLLFTQSNLRVLLGQDTLGRLYFVSAPHDTDYTLPTCVTDRTHPVTAHPGMYYQCDMAMLLGKMRFMLAFQDGPAAPAVGKDSRTFYLDDFLPLTETWGDRYIARVFSIAPVLEKEARDAAFKTLPLPGPSGCLYALHLTNTSDQRLSGLCRLQVEDNFVIRSEFNGVDPFESDCVKPYHAEWERDVFTMWRPDACASVHFTAADHNISIEKPDWSVPFDLTPGAEAVFTVRVAVTPSKEGIAPALTTLLRHDAFDWIQITRAFWKEHLGALELSLNGDVAISTRLRDMHVRSILDDFNCLQTDAKGKLLVHWQGAPSHNIGRFWGIDIEPTALSILYHLPELGRPLIEYAATHNEPGFSGWSDHSTPIRLAPLTISGKYLELTGDKANFKDNPELMKRLEDIVTRLMASKHEKYDLFSSRYSSDGIVFHRYDLGTNAKCWYALKSWAYIASALGDDERSRKVQTLLDGIVRDVRATMIADGPFGAQYTGGTNLGEGKNFYFRDDIFYYDGEDSSSCLMPLYGMIGFDDEAWRNYHRFARSLFLTNFDPEMGALRWFFYGGAMDGTAYVSRIGGSVTQAEMREALKGMLDCSVDVTGSLYWWPRGKNLRRCIARCSQGQGSWVIQTIEQWLGLKMDAEKRTLSVTPRGLVTDYRYENLRLGAFVFDISWKESAEGTRLFVVNKNTCPFTICADARPFGSGVDGPSSPKTAYVQPGESVCVAWSPACYTPVESCAVTMVETRRLSENGIVFGTFGLNLPSESCGTRAFLLRYVLINAQEAPIRDISLELKAPEPFGVAAKESQHWAVPAGTGTPYAQVKKEKLLPGERAVFLFYVIVKDGVDEQSAWMSAHPFSYPVPQSENIELCLCADEPFEGRFEAVLSYENASGNPVRKVQILPVKGVDAEQHKAFVEAILR